MSIKFTYVSGASQNLPTGWASKVHNGFQGTLLVPCLGKETSRRERLPRMPSWVGIPGGVYPVRSSISGQRLGREGPFICWRTYKCAKSCTGKYSAPKRGHHGLDAFTGEPFTRLRIWEMDHIISN